MGADVDPANVVELTGDLIYVVGEEIMIEVE